MSPEHAWIDTFAEPAALIDAAGRIVTWNSRGRLVFGERARVDVVVHGRGFSLGELGIATSRAGAARACTASDVLGRSWRLRLDPMAQGLVLVVFRTPRVEVREEVGDEATGEVFLFDDPRRARAVEPSRSPPPTRPGEVVPLRARPGVIAGAPPARVEAAPAQSEEDPEDEATVIEPYKPEEAARVAPPVRAPAAAPPVRPEPVAAPPPVRGEADVDAARARERLALALARSIRPLLTLNDVESAMREGLQQIGMATGADRCFVVLVGESGEGALARRDRLAWSVEGVPLDASPEAGGAASRFAVPSRWTRVLSAGGMLVGRIEAFPPEERAVLQRYGVCSTAIVPIRAEGRLQGFLGLDDCRQPRTWAPAETEILRGVADGFAAALRRRDAQRTLREARDRYESAVRGADLALWEVDARSGEVLHLEGGDPLLGLDPDALPRDVAAFLALVHPEDHATCRAAARAHGEGTSDRVDLEVRLKAHGVWKWVSLRGRITERDAQGRPGRAHGSLLDIDERKRLLEDVRTARQVAERASEAKTRFLANMSHEVRTPLNGVLGMAALLQGTSLSSQQSHLVETLRKSGEHLLALLTQILDLTEIESGHMKLEHGPLDLRALLLDLREVYRTKAEHKGLDLELRLDERLPMRAVGDERRVRQLLVALIDNAVKFTDRGSVRVEAWCPNVHDPLLVRVEVADTGPGIPADRIDTLFHPFAQADGSDARRHGGSGLGLTIATRLSEALGGALHVQSEPDVGTVFRFDMQLAPAEPGSTTLDEGRVPSDLRVLVVEDNVVNQKVALGMLHRLGCETEVRECGLDAVAAVTDDPPDVVLMDIQMPGMDGLEATRLIRERFGSGTSPWIIAVTAAAQAVDRQRSLASGMNDYLAKPVRLEELERALLRAAESVKVS